MIFRLTCVALLAMLFAAPPALSLAGTTGALVGDVVTGGQVPVADAKITVTSAAENESTLTDTRGHFTFVSLLPDVYAVTATKAGFHAVSQPGVEVFADNTQALRLVLESETKTLGTVNVSASPSLVRAGTVQNVYSVNQRLGSKLVALGGGGNLDFAYSAIAASPGTFVPPFQTGWNQPIFLRGGDFTEVGYELDGVPLNRFFDNITTTNLATLGQQQLQIYTGGAPADAQSHGLSGYINQVVRTGTYPGFADVTFGVGAPALYNKLNFEVGGATPDHRFSYYAATGGFDQDYRYVDQFNGPFFSQTFGQPFDLANFALGPNSPVGAPGCPPLPNGSNFAGCYANHGFFNALPVGPGGYILGPYNMGKNSRITDRESMVNLHFGFPHGQGINDDVQVLYDTSAIFTSEYSSFNDWGGVPFWSAAGAQLGAHTNSMAPPPTYAYPTIQAGFQYTGALLMPASGAPFGAIDNMIPYVFPSEAAFGANGQIAGSKRDGVSNGQSIFKVQYQHNFSPAAYVRVYGFTDYSDWFVHSPNSTGQLYISNSLDRELFTHERGFSAEYAAQISPRHLFDLQASYTSANTTFFDNTQMTNSTPGAPFFPSPQTVFAALVSVSAPTNGTCYAMNLIFPVAPVPVSCMTGSPSPFLTQKFLTYGGPFIPPPTGFEWLAVESGPSGQVNGVSPRFTSLSASDQWTPSTRLHFNLGLRFDRFQFNMPPTAGGASRAFWFNAWNNVMCVNPGINGGNPIDETLIGAAPGTPCAAISGPGIPAGALQPATLTNSTAGGSSVTFTQLEPRFGGTFTAGENDVIRFSYGKYALPPETQFEQYNTLQNDLPGFIGPLFYAFGFKTPEHDIRPPVSYNLDASWEHRFGKSDVAFKLTPFYRTTHDQEQQFFVNPSTGTFSGINAGHQNASGLEFVLTKGDLANNGLSVQLAYTYTYSRVHYDTLANGSTLLTPANASIQLYNSFTSACSSATPSTNPASLCGVNGNANASPCFSPGSVSSPGPPDPTCTGIGTVANPYFNAPARALLDPNGSYVTYHIVPTGTQLSSASFGVPSYATLLFNYRHNRWTFAPVFQYIAGSRYGSPQQQIGINPSMCGPLAAPLAGDPRYPPGSTSGNPYDATTCSGTMVIPDQFSGNFDAPGAFREPSFFSGHAQIGYEASRRVSYKLTLVNLFVTCSGGDAMPWTKDSGAACGYDTISGHLPPVGNIYNPGDPIQRLVKYPYGNAFTKQPIDAILNIEVKL
ncbi:MAG TPA: carboxypeptidase regulatory-like domain-containing protein [Candidatus Tumulicola sp.]|nr:carboxypeptidase regulatory-like domain-containing protein [Candidatus Tumulicola sp.]